MQYYNPQTKITISRQDLKTILHASIFYGIEEINGWYKLYNGQAPETQHGQSIIPDKIVFENGRYIQTYKVVGSATPKEPSYEERLSAVEDGVAELAQIIAETI